MSFTFPWRGSTNVKSRILAYLGQADLCMERFVAAFHLYLERGSCAEVDDLRNESHRAESAADDLRREIEQTLYEHELLPESRGDLLSLLESLDHIPGATQGVLNILFLEHPVLPEFLKPQLDQLVAINHEAYGVIHGAVVALMEDPSRTREMCTRVDELEPPPAGGHPRVVRLRAGAGPQAPDQGRDPHHRGHLGPLRAHRRPAQHHRDQAPHLSRAKGC